jgi:LmbE family N-acetylglucosaminyl deacetylase
MVIAAHPDDEVLGMAGTLHRHARQGDKVGVLFMGDGVSSREGGDDDAMRRREQAASAAAGHLGVDILGFGRFPDNALDTIPLLDLARFIEGCKGIFLPDMAYTHHGGDLNVDHRLTSHAVLTAFRPQPGERCTAVLAFEVASATEWSSPAVMPPFLPDTYVEISSDMEAARKALECYAEELREPPHARSFAAWEARTRYRGHQVGVDAAEAFVTLRKVLKEGVHA